MGLRPTRATRRVVPGMILAFTITVWPREPSAQTVPTSQLRIEFATDVDRYPTHVCVVSELGRQDSISSQPTPPTKGARARAGTKPVTIAASAPASSAADQVRSVKDPKLDELCRAPSSATDTTLPLACLRPAIEESTDSSNWTLKGDALPAIRDYLAQRGSTLAALKALSAPSTSGGCDNPPAACRPSFSTPDNVKLSYFNGKGTQYAPQALQMMCFPQTRVSRAHGEERVAVLFVEFAAPVKVALSTGKLVSNVITLGFSGPIQDRGGVSASVIGGHYAESRASYVVDGLVALPLDPRCSEHSVDLGRLSTAGAVQATVEGHAGPRECSGKIESGKMRLWLTRDEERRPGLVRIDDQREGRLVQRFRAIWDVLQPQSTLRASLARLSFDWRRGCFVAEDECPEIWVDDLVQCQLVSSQPACSYTCDATSHNATFSLPAQLTVKLYPPGSATAGGDIRPSAEEGAAADGSSGGARTARYRWHQLLPAAGAVLDEDISEPDGRAMLVKLPWNRRGMLEHGITVDRLTFRSGNETVVLEQPLSLPESPEGYRIPAPRFSCGDRLEIEYAASREIMSDRTEFGGSVLVTDPVEREVPGSIMTALTLFRSLPDLNTPPQRFTDGLGGRLDFVLQGRISSWSHLTLGQTIIGGVQSAGLIESGEEHPHALPWFVEALVLGGGFDIHGLMTLDTKVGLGMSVVTHKSIKGLDGAFFTFFAEEAFTFRYSRHWGMVMELGANFRDPKRTVDPATGAVSGKFFVRPQFAVGAVFFWL